MRFATLLRLILPLAFVAASAQAQDCDPANYEVPCPDTTDWRRYFPLEVGNAWQYREVNVDEGGDEVETFWGREITGQQEVEGRTYFVVRQCMFADEEVTCRSEPSLLRYDEEHAMVVRRMEEGDVWWPILPCRLDAAFNASGEDGWHTCTGPGTYDTFYLPAEGQYGATVTIPSDVVSGDTRKWFGTPIFTSTTVYAGIGPTAYEDELHPEPTRLVYARVGGEEYGTHAFNFPAASEPGAAPVAAALTAAFPNPAQDAVTVRYELDQPRAVTLEVVDLLGRRMRTLEVGVQPAGPHEARVETAVLPAGLYLLHLRSEAAVLGVRRVVVAQ